jgi:general secretion pathway protein K
LKVIRVQKRAQRGVAIVAVMLIVMLATAIVSSLYYRETIAIRSIENRLTLQQTRWVERAVLDWSRVILRADAQNPQTAAVDHLQEVWAVPVADTVLDETVTAGASIKSSADSGAGGAAGSKGGARDSARLSGGMEDAQGKLNLNNLVNDKGVQSPEHYKAFEKLLQLTGQPLVLAQNLLTRQMSSSPVTQNNETIAATTPALLTIDDLKTVKGFNPDVIRTLDPFVIFLPRRTTVNVNTAPAETIAAVVPDLDLAGARRFVSNRERTFYRDLATAGTAIGNGITLPTTMLDVKTSHFLVKGTLKFDRVEASTETLLHRLSARQVEVVWQRRL